MMLLGNFILHDYNVSQMLTPDPLNIFVSFRTPNGRPLLILSLCEKSFSDMHHNGFDSVLFDCFLFYLIGYLGLRLEDLRCVGNYILGWTIAD